MPKKIFTLIVLGFLTLYAVHSLLSLTEPPSSPQGLVSYRLSLDGVSVMVPIPVSCDYHWTSELSLLTCNCEERFNSERASHELVAELSGNVCEEGEKLCRALCHGPETLAKGFVLPPGMKPVPVKRIIADWGLGNQV